MRLVSTRSPERGEAWTFAEALFEGLAPDGGLFVPHRIDPLEPDVIRSLRGRPFAETATLVGEHLLAGEPAVEAVAPVVADALDFPIPLRPVGPSRYALELFHGPTLAFKDVGARFMARMMSALSGSGEGRRTVLVATSGDTGGAVAQAFHGVAGVDVAVLFPVGRVSPRQAAQFTTLGGNVLALGIEGSFDDCQRLVKEAFAEPALKRRLGLTSANSINVGRLVPQVFYWVHAWASLPDDGREIVVSVPSGNFGNLTAGLVAHALGIPFARIVAGTNANRPVPDYLEGRPFRPRDSVKTLSNAMDVGNPSNFERMLHHFGGGRDRMSELISASSWSDEETRACIRRIWLESGRVIDPHTAVGHLALEAELRDHPGANGVVLATAHPAKFAETIEPLIGEALDVPPALAEAMGRETREERLAPELAALEEALRQAFGR